jgi:hypothetical protein
MIKKFLKTGIVLTFAAVSLPALAQIGELRNNIAVGVNGGMNFSNVSFTPKIKQKTTNGMTGEIFRHDLRTANGTELFAKRLDRAD